ncbi:MAG: inactive transglutaminase family protein [Legionellaceae bacterium]|nr:inactive transglutaminase family protein [Legionellaceae bacterium]
MKSRTRHLCGLIVVLLVLGVGIFLYRALVLDVPFTATKTVNSWMVEANLRFTAERNRPVQARFTIPYMPPHLAILDEYFVSQNYGVMTNLIGDNRQAVWSLRRSSGPQSLYYRAIFREADNQVGALRKPTYPKVQVLPDNQKAAVDTIITQARQSSADIQTFAQSTIQELNKQDGNAKLLLGGDNSKKAVVQAVIQVLNQAKIEALPVQGFYLKQDNRAEAHWFLAVYNGQAWLYLNPETGALGLPKHFLVWQYGTDSLFEVAGGKAPQFSLTVSPTPMNALSAAKTRGLQAESNLMRFSLLTLPVNVQETYKILLMIPIGAFIILLLRNFIGLMTFGTFMPVLIALAFRETQVIWGVVLFTVIVSFGLLVRFYLDELRLLLVPRLAVILTVVILLMLFISVMSQSLDLRAGLSVALFPMIILTMTIERMCITWDERGAYEAVKCGAGSLVAAIVAFAVMNWSALQYLMFAFPELLFVLLALILIFGQYQGYRLFELFRFKALAEPS